MAFSIIWRGNTNGSSVDNCYNGRNGQPIRAIVDHIMEGSLNSTDGWFKNSLSQASTHFGVGLDGRIFQWVRLEDSAWGNGVTNISSSSPDWLKRMVQAGINPNFSTISIEHEGYTGNIMTESQYQATLWLHKYLLKTTGLSISKDTIIGHYQVDIVNRPFCPGNGFPWAALINNLLEWDKAGRPDISSPSLPVPNNQGVINLNGHNIGHGFLDFYRIQGGGSQDVSIRNVGLPLSDEYTGPDNLVTQVFERYVLEYDPSSPLDWQIRGKHLGRLYLETRPELNQFVTDKAIATLGFGEFYNSHGGLKFLGLPLTNEFKDPKDGMTRQVFERYVLEYDPTASNEWKVRGANIGQTWLQFHGISPNSNRKG
jgi:hypothetical protein